MVDARPRLQTSSGTTDRRGSQSPTGTCNWRANCISDFPHPGIAIPGSRSCSKLGGSNLRRHETAVRTLLSVPSSKLSFTLFFRSGSSCLTRAPVSNFPQMIFLPMHWSTVLEGVKFDPDGVFSWVTEEGKDKALAGWEEKVSLSKMVLELEMSALLRSIKADSILPGSLPFMYIFPSGPISDHARELTTGQEQPWHKGPGLSLCSSRNSTLPRSHLMAGLTVRRVCRSKCQSKRGCI
jgi:hypothetical protein